MWYMFIYLFMYNFKFYLLFELHIVTTPLVTFSSSLVIQLFQPQMFVHFLYFQIPIMFPCFRCLSIFAIYSQGPNVFLHSILVHVFPYILLCSLAFLNSHILNNMFLICFHIVINMFPI